MVEIKKNTRPQSKRARCDQNFWKVLFHLGRTHFYKQCCPDHSEQSILVEHIIYPKNLMPRAFVLEAEENNFLLNSEPNWRTWASSLLHFRGGGRTSRKINSPTKYIIANGRTFRRKKTPPPNISLSMNVCTCQLSSANMFVHLRSE